MQHVPMHKIVVSVSIYSDQWTAVASRQHVETIHEGTDETPYDAYMKAMVKAKQHGASLVSNMDSMLFFSEAQIAVASLDVRRENLRRLEDKDKEITSLKLKISELENGANR